MYPASSQLDYLFAGAGASTTLLLLSMESRGLLKDKKIIILDPDTKLNNDKTYCFWAEQTEKLTLRFNHLISHQWNEISVNRNPQVSLLPQQYFHISGIDLYKELRRVIDQYGLIREYSSVIDLIPITNGVKVITDTNVWESSMVFDSRPPKYRPPKKDDAHLIQSFIGYVITTDKPIENKECVDLMDFHVNQQNACQFMYVLPIGEGKTLVELTRFGCIPILKNEASPILHEYINHRFGNYEIIKTETGCIPMSTAAIFTETIPGVIPIGSRAGAVKPSTGYAFKNMFNHAERLADSLEKNTQPTHVTTSLRFRFYDRLLLLILTRLPLQGKIIFEWLFKKNEAKTILKFLDEKTTVFQDIKIFLTLPFKPFIKAVGWVVASRMKALKNPLVLFFFSLLLCLIYNRFPNIYNQIQIIVFVLGMFLIGIPHGAVDHLLDTDHFTTQIKSAFVIKYLMLTFLNLALWLLYPMAALLFFIGYSAWHFGQTDFQEWKPKNKNAIKSTAWGILILGIILYGHLSETNIILDNMHVWKMPFNEMDGENIMVWIVMAALLWAMLEKNWMMFISILTLMMSIHLPLITSFGLYFIGQHSMNGWSHLKKGMNINNTSLYLKALPFTIGALALFATFLFLLRNDYFTEYYENLITVFFIFISCISLPHVIAMNKFYRPKLL